MLKRDLRLMKSWHEFVIEFWLLVFLVPPSVLGIFRQLVPNTIVVIYSFIVVYIVYVLHHYRILVRSISFWMLIIMLIYFAFRLNCHDIGCPGRAKYINIFGNSLLYFSLGLLAARQRPTRFLFFYYYVAIACVAAIYSLYIDLFVEFGGVLNSGQYQTLGYYISLGILALFPLWMIYGKKCLWPLLPLALFYLALATTGNSSSFGIVTGLITICFLMFVARQPARRTIASGIILFALVLVCFTTYTLWQKKIPMAIFRIPYKISLNDVRSAGKIHPAPTRSAPEIVRTNPSRLDMVVSSYYIWRKAPAFGVGLGAWPAHFLLFFKSKENYQYPHDIYVELATETGLIGLAFFVTMIICALVPAMRRLDDAQAWFCLLGLCFWLLVHVLGGSITNKWLYLFVGLCAGIGLRSPAAKVDASTTEIGK